MKHTFSVERRLPDGNFSWNAIKYNDFVKIIPFQKSFRMPLEKELASRISDKYFKADEIFESIDIFKKKNSIFFISPSTSYKAPNTNLYLYVCTHTYTHICEERELLSFLLSYCLPLPPPSLWELGSFSSSQWLLEKASFLTGGYILATRLNTALQ